MKQQVIFLSWWIPKENYSSYYDYLRKQDFDPYLKKERNRKYFLWEHLWDNYEYHIVPFPEVHYADYTAWKIVFEKMIPYMHHEITFVATSLWWSFITKYLSENTLQANIKKLIMLAPAIYDTPDEVLGSFLPDTSQFDKIQAQCENIFIYHSVDDSMVPFSDSVKYLQYFPKSVFRKFTNKWHFNFEKRIIEVEEDIKK